MKKPFDPDTPRPALSELTSIAGFTDDETETELSAAKANWYFGEWHALADIDVEKLENNSNIALFHALKATGHFHLGAFDKSTEFFQRAKRQGCDNKVISSLLISGIHNTLGRIKALERKDQEAEWQFSQSVKLGSSGRITRLMQHARAVREMAKLGLVSEAAGLLGEESENLNNKVQRADESQLRLRLLKDEVELLKRTSKNSPTEPLEEIARKVKQDIEADAKLENRNPYSHNRTLTAAWNRELRQFAAEKLGIANLKTTYIDYLATKAIQIEKNCVGRLATTIQDAVARQLIAESVGGQYLCVLEIGALYGVSLAILYNHAVTRYESAKIVCLDPFDGYYGNAIDAVLNSPVNDFTFKRNMHLANVPSEDYQLIKEYSTSPAALSAVSKNDINLLIIDGDHSYEGVKFDFDNYCPLLQPGGYVVFDDYNAKEWPAVQKFIDEDIIENQTLEYLGSISRTAVARKR